MNIKYSSIGRFILKQCSSYFCYSTYHIYFHMTMKFSREFFSVFNLLDLFRNKKDHPGVLEPGDWKNGCSFSKKLQISLLTF